jgi:gliding motility-associated-like protein
MRVYNKHTLLLILIALCPCFLLAQKENNIWYFGNMVGLDFNSGTPVKLTNSQMDTREGCSSVADDKGNLLFYTDGITVWNKNHSLMSNGTWLKGNSSSTQSSVVVKKPGSQNLYYIFNPDCSESATGGLHYSIVDISKNGGLGEVIEKNTLLLAGTLTEKIATIKDGAGCGFWILTRTAYDNYFYAFALTISGINTTPVKSATPINYARIDVLGYLKASPDGSKIASANYGSRKVELYDFDNTTGKITNTMVIDSGYSAYGCSFSPNGNLLYACPFGKPDIFQYNVSLGTQSAIRASKVTVYSKSTGPNFGALQLGPDKKIYITKEGNGYLGIINNPDNNGVACNYKDSGFFFGTSTSSKLPRLGLPNFIDNPNPFAAALSLGPDIDLCVKTTFTLSPPTLPNGHFLWSTGDTTQTIAVNQPGTYWLQAEISCGASASIVSDTIVVKQVTDTLPLHLGNDTALCGAASITVGTTPLPNVSYLWSTGQTTPSISVNTSNQYWLKTTSACGIKSDTINVSIDSVSISPIFIGNDTAVCNTAITLKTGIPNTTKHLWSTGATTNTITADTSGIYWVKVSNSCDAVYDTIKITRTNLMPIQLGQDTNTCETSKVLLTSSLQNAHYLWSTGDTTQTITVTKTGNYTLTISNSCGTETDSILVNFITDINGINIGNDTSICSGQISIDGGDITGAKYKWSTGDTTQTTIADTAGVYKLTVTTMCNNSFEDSIRLSFYQTKPLKLIDDVTECSESFTEVILDASYPYKSYLWNIGSREPKITITQPDTYILSVTDSCEVVFTDTVTLTICDCKLQVPNAFTPNNDGLNDVFNVSTECIPQKYAIKIYNRWGSLVYEGIDLHTGWDGTYKGVQVPEGVYFVTIDYYYATSHRKPFYSGSITVLR